MRHRKSRSLQNRFTSWRKATLSSLARSVIINQRITTTVRKAKAVKPLLDRLISMAKENTLAKRRAAFAILGDHKLVSVLFDDLGVRFKNRTGGYTRILRLASRRGDSAEMAIFELTELKKEPKKARTTKVKESKTAEAVGSAPAVEKAHEEKKEKAEEHAPEKGHDDKKPPKKFLGGLKNIFKKERDSL